MSEPEFEQAYKGMSNHMQAIRSSLEDNVEYLSNHVLTPPRARLHS
jgi:hypothetical protein